MYVKRTVLNNFQPVRVSAYSFNCAECVEYYIMFRIVLTKKPHLPYHIFNILLHILHYSCIYLYK